MPSRKSVTFSPETREIGRAARTCVCGKWKLLACAPIKYKRYKGYANVWAKCNDCKGWRMKEAESHAAPCDRR